MIAHTTQQLLEGHPFIAMAAFGAVLILAAGASAWALLTYHQRQRLRFEMLLTDLFADFAHAGPEETDGKIRAWLEVIARFFGVDRTAFCRLEEDGSGSRILYDYAAENIPHLPGHLAAADAPWIYATLYAGHVVNVRRAPFDLPADAVRDREHFQRLRLKSLLIVPMRTRENGTYIVSFGCVRGYGHWGANPHLRLRLICEVFANALAKCSASQTETRLAKAVEQEQRRVNEILSDFRGIVWELCGAPSEPGSRMEYVSENVEQLLGYTAQDWTSTPQFWLKVLHPDDREDAVRSADELFARGGFGTQQFRWITKEGVTLWMEAHMAVTVAPDGHTTGLRGVIHDISKRKQAEHAYEESQRLIRRIAETMPSVLYLYEHAENRNVFCNRRIQTVLGYSEEEVNEMGGDLLNRLVHPDDAENVFAHAGKLGQLADEDVMELEYRLRARNGEYRWLFGRETVFTRGADGRPRSILGVAHDVTERRRDQLALKVSEELNRSVIDSLTSLIVIVDREGRVLTANRAWQRRWAETRQDGAGPLNIGEELLPPATDPNDAIPDSTRAFREGLEGVLGGRREDFRMEYAVESEQAASWFELSVLALRRDAGGAVICHSDITARKEAEEELQKSHEQVRALAGRLISAQEEERRRIAQELHDDLSQRLAAQAISLSNLQRDFRAGEHAVVEAGIEKLRASAVSIADDVRAISHELHPPVLMFAGLSACLESLCREFTANNGLRVAYRVESDPGRVSSDVALCLYRAAQEALRNVCKHARASSATVTLTRGPEGILMRIEDDGVGVVEDRAGQRPGLGLISLRERAHVLRGSFSVTPRSAGGTCVEVGIPGD